MLYFEFFKNDYKLRKMVKVPHRKFCDLIFFCSSKIQMIIKCMNMKSH